MSAVRVLALLFTPIWSIGRIRYIDNTFVKIIASMRINNGQILAERLFYI